MVLGNLYDILKAFKKEKHPGDLVIQSPIDIYFDEGNVVQPDIVYITEATGKRIIKGRIEGAPDFVVEILSLSNAYYDLRKKKDLYQKNGVKEYLIVDPIEQNAELYILEDGVYALNQKAQLTDIIRVITLPGLSIDLSTIFI